MAESGVMDAFPTSQQPVTTTTEPTSGLQTKTDPVTGEVVEGDPFAPPVDTTSVTSVEPAGIEATTATTVERDPRDMPDRPFVTQKDQKAYDEVYQLYRRAGSSDKDARELADDVIQKAGNLNITDPSGLVDQEKKDIRRLGERQRAERSLDTTDYGRKQLAKIQEKQRKKDEVVQDTFDFLGGDYDRDDDRDDGGPASGIDDFFGGDFGMPSQPTQPSPKTDTYADLTGNPFGDRGRTQTSQPIGTGGGGRGQRFGPTGGFYVGGVPTKPMKPQRLKKGGLAKPKVKPKRMKKGGLASSRKK